MATMLRATCTRPAPFSSGPARLQRRPIVIVHAEPPASPQPPSAEQESKLELLESAVKRKQSAAPRQIPIRGVNQPTSDTSAASNMAPWKEGALFPEGFDQMNLGQKITELYMGRRGLLFWSNKIAYASVFVLLGAWVIFRFVGPNLGLYTLAGDLQPPPF